MITLCVAPTAFISPLLSEQKSPLSGSGLSSRHRVSQCGGLVTPGEAHESPAVA